MNQKKKPYVIDVVEKIPLRRFGPLRVIVHNFLKLILGWNAEGRKRKEKPRVKRMDEVRRCMIS